MYVIEAGEGVIYFSIKFSLNVGDLFARLFQVTINYLPMAEEGGEVREVRQKYLRYRDELFF